MSFLNLTSMDSYSFANQSIKQWKQIMMQETFPADIYEKIEDMIDTLEYIRDWEPSDVEMIANNSCGTPWHDGCR
jgi:hypothetical protein